MTASIAAILLATTVGSTDVLGQERRKRQRVRPAAATVSVQSSDAIVQALGFDGLGTLHNDVKGDDDFPIFDKTARFNDTDDRPRGAAAKAEQLTTILDLGSSVTVASRSEATARYYDRRTGDDTQPKAEANELLSVTIDVAGGAGDRAFFALRGSIHGEASGGGSSGCAQVEVTAPNGTIIQGGGGCVGSFTIPIDESGPLDPGSYSLGIDSSAEALTGFAMARAKTTWNLSLVLGACDVLGTPVDDPNLDGTNEDDVICGFGGDDTINGLNGNDIIFGGAGIDSIDAGLGADTVFGGPGNDKIDGGGGRDGLFGGTDGDIIRDARGPNPILDGGDGVDHICGSPQRDTIRGGGDPDILHGRGGPDEIFGDGGDDDIFGDAERNCPPGGPGATRGDTIDGGPGDDLIRGGPDRDTITGGRDKDRLFGEAANDKLNACDGIRDDAVSGGPGGNDVVRRDGNDPSSGNEVRRPC